MRAEMGSRSVVVVVAGVVLTSSDANVMEWPILSDGEARQTVPDKSCMTRASETRTHAKKPLLMAVGSWLQVAEKSSKCRRDAVSHHAVSARRSSLHHESVIGANGRIITVSLPRLKELSSLSECMSLCDVVDALPT